MSAHVVIAGSATDFVDAAEALIERAECSCLRCSNSEEAIAALTREPCDLLLLGADLASDAPSIIERIAMDFPEVGCIVEVDAARVRLALDVLRAGALDVIVAPADADQLERALTGHLNAARLTDDQPPPPPPGSSLVGSSARMEEVRRLVARAATLRTAVLLVGEVGTGRRTVARSIHAADDPQKRRPFVEIACAVDDTGAWTRLVGEECRGGHRPGGIDAAEGGTLYVTRLDQASLEQQRLLHDLIAENTYQPAGSPHRRSADVRMLVSTEVPIRTLLSEGRIFDKLAYRLGILPIALPPLRKRRGDIAQLAACFAQRSATHNRLETPRFAPEALRLLEAQPWEGNVAQLESFVERLVVFSDEPLLEPSFVEEELSRFIGFVARIDGGTRSTVTSSVVPLSSALQDAERRAVTKALRRARNNRTVAARILGISRRTLYTKLRDHDIAVEVTDESR